jgi:hypothetical protein
MFHNPLSPHYMALMVWWFANSVPKTMQKEVEAIVWSDYGKPQKLQSWQLSPGWGFNRAYQLLVTRLWHAVTLYYAHRKLTVRTYSSKQLSSLTAFFLSLAQLFKLTKIPSYNGEDEIPMSLTRQFNLQNNLKMTVLFSQSMSNTFYTKLVHMKLGIKWVQLWLSSSCQ